MSTTGRMMGTVSRLGSQEEDGFYAVIVTMFYERMRMGYQRKKSLEPREVG